jgi:chorismate lyase / 3-hydroxybenzoate synthase
MAHTQDTVVRAGTWLPPLVARPPAWVAALLGSAPYAVTALAHAALGDLHVASADGVTHVTASILNAAELSASALEQAVATAYHALAGALAQAGCHPVRFWNFIPGIHAAMGDDRDRYMVFNAGRFAAFASFYGSPANFSRALPTASAVGVREGPLVVHGLGLESAGAPLENPRQIPAYAYSRRYGPRPPCFARATLVQSPRTAEPWLLVGGTASILGEDSIHVRDVRRQALETFDNLSRLVASGRPVDADLDGDESTRDELAAFRELRVYIVNEEHADVLQDMVRDRFPNARRIEFAQADLCRQELLVEIEGVAVL